MENARRAAFSFFPKRSGGCAPEAFVVAKQPSAALSVTRRKFRHMTCGALAAFWKVEMFLSRCGTDAPGKNERVAPLPLWARIPRVYIWNNEPERAKDAICERPLNLYVCRGAVTSLSQNADTVSYPMRICIQSEHRYWLVLLVWYLYSAKVLYPYRILVSAEYPAQL